jgi:tyrosinase
MNVQIDITGADAQGRVFLTWAPVQATARMTGGADGATDVVLRSAGSLGGLVFDAVRSDQGASSLTLSLPNNGQPVAFFVAGEFQKPSSTFGDAVLEASDKATGNVLGSKPVMVRIRKNAQTLPVAERDRYLAALGILNARGQGAYRDFRDMHTDATTREMHGDAGFLPWHRAYALDLERALQAIDATVTLPYWRFDQPAPNLFTRDYMGESNAQQMAVFRPGHPLEQWVTDHQLGITRGLDFNINGPANVIDELSTINLGDDYTNFANEDSGIEIDPHGSAHVSFTEASSIFHIGTAVRDPVFFMLHANVDRLWAKWQWVKHRARSTDPGAFTEVPASHIGHHLADTMWPWNGITGRPRPRTAPGGAFPPSTMTQAPGPTPKVGNLLDHLAVTGGAPLGYAYDDVPFQLPPTVVAGGR